MSDTPKADAQAALFKAIANVTEYVENGDYYPGEKAPLLRDLALAYRYAAGGAQPGGIHIEKG